ncbi:MAG: nucleotidyltransferase family protein [Parcubacteria group bacterium]
MKMDVNLIRPIFDRYGVEYAGLFGSFARGEEHETSDIDIVVRLKKPIGLFSLAKLQQELSTTLERKVDLVTEGGLSPYLRQSIANQIQPIYGSR